jgi:hypothetical protein
MEELLNLAAPKGGFEAAPDIKGTPVPNEEVLENIRASTLIDAPLFKRKPKRNDIMVYVGAGPSMRGFIDEIRERSLNGDFIVTSNMTYDFLFSHGIVANAVLIIDPKKIVATYIKNPQKETQFYIGVVCNPEVAKGLLEKGMNIEKVFVGYGIEDESDVELQKTLYKDVEQDYLVGGTMTGLRIMNFSIMLGFKAIEYYGLDSCFGDKIPGLIFEDEPRFDEVRKKNNMYYEDAETGKKYAIDEGDEGGFFYSFKKKHGGNIQVAKTPDGRRFLTSPVFAHQAKQFIKWYDRLEGKLKIILHGDNLTSHLLKCHLENIENKKAIVGDRKWSDKNYSFLQERFSNGNHRKVSDNIMEAISEARQSLKESIRKDPSVLDYDKSFLNITDGKYDIVLCINLMEYIEIECIDNVLKDIKEHNKYMIIFHISFNEDDAIRHQKSGEWWKELLEKYFMVVEGAWICGKYATFVCQNYDAQEYLKEEVL